MSWHYKLREARRAVNDRLANPDPFVLVRGLTPAHGPSPRATYYRLGQIMRANLAGWRLRLGDFIVLPLCKSAVVRAIGCEGHTLVIDVR